MQSSYLTRRVFRALLNNEVVCFSPRRTRIYSSPPTTLYRTRKTYSDYGQSRTFFSFTAPPRQEKEIPTSEVGLQAMSELSIAMRTSGRAPSFDVLCRAFQRFFEARAEEPGVITEFHAKQLVNTYKYLRTQQKEQQQDTNNSSSSSNSIEWEMINSKEMSELILYVLSQATCHRNSHLLVRELAQNAYNNILSAEDPGEELSYGAILAWVRILAFYGNPYQAHKVLLTWWPKLQSWSELDAQGASSPWLWVLHGLALKQDITNIGQLVTKLSGQYNFDLSSQQQEELVLALLEQDQLAAAKIIYTCPLPKQAQPTSAAMVAVCRASILSGDVDWTKDILRPHWSSPTAKTRDVLLLMSAAKGGRASDLAKKLKKWCSENPLVRDGLSVSCVNDLIRYANMLGDAQLAVEYSQLIPQWNLESDLDTFFLLELESRIQASDVDGTVKSLRDLEEKNDDDASTSINLAMRYRLIKMLCAWPDNDDAFDQVTKLLDPLVQHGTQLEPETLAALTHLLAYRHDWEALSQLLRSRLNTYSPAHERPLIREPLLKFIHDRSQPPDEVWEAYQLMRMAFPDTSSNTRISIMKTFFERNMLDKGCQVFGHMRHATSAHHRPTTDAYITCFLGLARAADWPNIKLIRNMLKLDVDIDMTTRLRNAVMLALASCHRADEAMTEFSEILRSDEGPSHTTLLVFFKVCESAAHTNGVADAQKMMRKIIDLEIPLDRELYLAYVRAVAAQGEHELAIEALEETEAKIGRVPDKDMIARIYNACPHEYAKEGIEEWAKRRHPDIWQELERGPRSEREEGVYLEGFEDVFVP